MTAAVLNEIERLINEKNRRIEQRWVEGNLRLGVEEFYTDDVRYLTPDFRLLVGRAAVVEFLDGLRAHHHSVRLHPLETLGDPVDRRVVYQFANATLHAPDGTETGDAHYVATFRPVGNDWLCEMEAPVFGKMTLTGVQP